jgi:hypothetical protein
MDIINYNDFIKSKKNIVHDDKIIDFNDVKNKIDSNKDIDIYSCYHIYNIKLNENEFYKIPKIFSNIISDIEIYNSKSKVDFKIYYNGQEYKNDLLYSTFIGSNNYYIKFIFLEPNLNDKITIKYKSTLINTNDLLYLINNIVLFDNYLSIIKYNFITDSNMIKKYILDNHNNSKKLLNFLIKTKNINHNEILFYE